MLEINALNYKQPVFGSVAGTAPDTEIQAVNQDTEPIKQTEDTFNGKTVENNEKLTHRDIVSSFLYGGVKCLFDSTSEIIKK
ncbi:MAG: hypothetical protein PHC34_08880, partial [Candidatus Gastranaerophilales bacterium]|nr:hypothetical protein [Candidatus Gastranaerophilales bacterium]